MSDYEPKIVCFSCRFGWGYLAEEKKLAQLVPNWVPIVCSGRLDSRHIVNAFEQGADGVLVLGCPEGDCHFQDGNFEARRKVYLLQKLLESFGIEKDRLRIHLSVDPEGRDIPGLIREMSESIAGLGPVKKASRK